MDNKELAEKLKISAPNISGWLKGTREIPAKYISVLSKIFRGLPGEYFQKELTNIEEIRIRIHYIETMDFEDRHGELVVSDPDGKIILDSYEDDFANLLEHLYAELKQAVKKDSYEARVRSVFELLWSLDKEESYLKFGDKNAEDFIVSKLNNYLDFLVKFKVADINVVDSIINYLINYKSIDESKWDEQELIPNEKLISFYKDLSEVLRKHKVI